MKVVRTNRYHSIARSICKSIRKSKYDKVKSMVKCAVCASPSAAVFCGKTCQGLCLSCATQWDKCAVCREPLRAAHANKLFFSRYTSLFRQIESEGRARLRLKCSNDGCGEKFCSFDNLLKHSMECKSIRCYGSLLDRFEKSTDATDNDKEGEEAGCGFVGDFDAVDKHMVKCPKALYVLAERLDRRVKELEQENAQQGKHVEELQSDLDDARWEAEERAQEFADYDDSMSMSGDDSNETDDDEDYSPSARSSWPGAS